jgi:hypothetical protein
MWFPVFYYRYFWCRDYMERAIYGRHIFAEHRRSTWFVLALWWLVKPLTSETKQWVRHGGGYGHIGAGRDGRVNRWVEKKSVWL